MLAKDAIRCDRRLVRRRSALVVEEPAIEPGPGQARVAVHAAGVNPVD